MSPELKKLSPNLVKPKRNRQELSITNGFEFGIGFWLAGILVMFFGVPALTCITIVVLGVIGRNGN